MPHPPSAKKRHRQSLRRAERNQARRTASRSAVRRARESIASGDQAAAEAAVREASTILDRTASKGVVHPNNAARRKSRLMKQLHAMGEATEAAPRKRRTRAPAKKAPARSTRSKKS